MTVKHTDDAAPPPPILYKWSQNIPDLGDAILQIWSQDLRSSNHGWSRGMELPPTDIRQYNPLLTFT